MRGVACFVLFLLLWTSPTAFSSSLSYTVEGVGGELADNIAAWLGDEPQTPQARSFFLAQLDERVKNSLRAVGYYHSEINTHIDRSHEQWQLSIDISLNAPVLLAGVELRLLGEATQNSDFKELLSGSTLVSGSQLNHGEYENFKKSLLNLGQRQGYFDGEFTVHRIEVDVERNIASIELEYDSGSRYRFGELLFDQQQVDFELVDKLRTFHTGEYFDLAKLQALQTQLQQTRYFSSVVVVPQLQGVADHEVPIALTLHPAKRHNIDVGVGFSTDTEERVSLTWRSPKLNRFGHSQETRFEYSPINPSGRVSYTIPLRHPLNDVLQFSARLEDNEFGDIDSQQKELATRREIKSAEGWIRSYFLRALNESWSLDSKHNDNAYILPGVTLAHKRRKGILVDPTAGFSQLYRLEGGSKEAGSDIDLLRFYSNFTFVTTPRIRHRVVARAELGAVFISAEDRKDLAPSLGFFAGGSQSIRGFGYQSLGNEVLVTNPDGTVKSLTIGGDRLLTASLEYQYYVNDSWRGAVFVDAGDAFDEGQFDVNVGLGFGVHYLTPVGAIKVELANSVSDDDPSWRFIINIGAEF
jgi:translocation and assembly module TamA